MTFTNHTFLQRCVEAAKDGADHGRVDRECVLDNGLEPDEDMALEAMYENEPPPPADATLLGHYQRAYFRAFLGRDE